MALDRPEDRPGDRHDESPLTNSLGLPGAPAQTRVVAAMSGGVDSSVVAAMLSREGYALPDPTRMQDGTETPRVMVSPDSQQSGPMILGGLQLQGGMGQQQEGEDEHEVRARWGGREREGG